MPKLTIDQIAAIDVETATRMSRPDLIVSLVAAADMVRRLANQAAADSSNSSRPPSRDSPYQRDRGGGSPYGGGQEAASGEAKPGTAPATPPVIPQAENFREETREAVGEAARHAGFLAESADRGTR